VAGEYKNPNARLQHFIDAATVAELASFYSLIIKDMGSRLLDVKVPNKKIDNKETTANEVPVSTN
jgi:hypothetical protein